MRPSVTRRVTRRTGLLLAEGPRAAIELGVSSTLAPVLAADKRGDGHPVLVLPGFFQHDLSTLILRTYLRWLNYSVSGWDLGTNLGSTESVVTGLRNRVTTLAESSGQRVTLVGWSLGGVYAHELVRRSPACVRQVVTLGSPVQLAGRRGRSASRAADHLARLNLAPPMMARPWREAGSLRVPATSVYSRSDGVVPWEACRLGPGKHRQNIEVFASHHGLGHNPSVLHVIADRLAQPEHSWRPFTPGAVLRTFYP